MLFCALKWTIGYFIIPIIWFDFLAIFEPGGNWQWAAFNDTFQFKWFALINFSRSIQFTDKLWWFL